MGYSCLYKKRTGNEDDGCAIYFKNSVFHMEDHIFVEFNHAFFTILCRHEVGLAVRLVLRDARASALPLIVATTRLCISFRSDYVRLAQLQIFLAHLERFANNGHLQGYHPIILTGCMGAQHNSSVIQFITNGHVSVSKTKINGTEMQNFHPENPPRMEGPLNAWDKCLPYFSELEHPFSFHSVYAHRKKNGSREVTTLFFANWKNFDYIFFSHDSRLRLLARYRLPTEAECRQLFQPLSVPSLKLPSSHFYLAAIFEFGSSSN
ncbi:PREDICTED: protein angel homolog 1-like [Papilio xuthus]|uniref:Protein angel homolog 1-like n=1 Tax=Papilio xuthus TaxID=66420 RepID=A0AAJ6ZYX5_PAPXU|nr:PREDICTED: protein angel homolog 1-like [Papilio xuthus]